jgi:phosphatidylglycerophosphatase A
MGTIGAIPAGLAILYFLSPATLFLAALLLTVISIREINKFEANGGEHDDSRIVLDEVAGTWIALSMTAAIPLFIQIVTVFVFFRFLDIKKPSIIGLAERKLKGGTGVMVDDLLAGLFAGVMSWGAYKALLFFGAV